ncbi:hypothetical protein QBC42DRAFT_276360 [Cladorrhinum samala]|uniref:Mitochondrial transcription factor 1 n=1 Tax=Cladorrhinum samala TaxID=585594 RepID=A0AAV9HCV2_9PEZI|nr:hypothetical protein QBC42DRAFT_276360 [Cladorrhinum samala]
MFTARLHLRAFLPRARNGCAALQHRHAGSLTNNRLQATNEVAQHLADSGNWKARGTTNSKSPARPKKTVKADRHRVNVVSEELCDDIIKYIGSTLDRHKGCDILDLFPGAGVWSRKMNDYLQPRSHILLEPDQELYRPLLEPLLQRPGARLIPESGIIWEELNKVLNSDTLPHQVEKRVPPSETPEKNDTLLVLANLSMYPKKRFRSFESLAQLVLYQLISSIRPGALMHKYGLVRMLFWTADMEKFNVVPRTIQRRRRFAFETEINTESITEIASADTANLENDSRGFFRDQSIDMESMQLAYKRMKKLKISPIPGRETKLLREYLDILKKGKKGQIAVAGEQVAWMQRPFRQEQILLQEKADAGTITEDEYKRLKSIQYKINWTDKRQNTSLEMLKEAAEVEHLYHLAHHPKLKQRALEKAVKANKQWCERVDSLEKTLANEFLLNRDNLHVFKQDPPVLNWDRRYVEPLVVRENEFYPNVPCALLDIQPRAIDSVLREMGPGTSRAGDTFDLLLRALMSYTVAPISKALDNIYPGAWEGLKDNCPSLTDPAKGGRYAFGYGELRARSLNIKQLVEIAEAWQKWPFKPSWPELVSRTSTEDGLEGYEGDSQSSSRWDL